MLRGAATDDDDLRALGLEATLGSITLPLGDRPVPIMIDADGNVETRIGKNIRKLGTIFSDGEPTKLCLWAKPQGHLGKLLHRCSVQYRDIDGRTLLETGPLDFDVAAGPAL